MDWMELTVLTTTAGADMVSQILMDAGSMGTMIEDKNDVAANQRPEGQWDIIDEAIAERIGDDVKVTGYFPMDDNFDGKSDMSDFRNPMFVRFNNHLSPDSIPTNKSSLPCDYYIDYVRLYQKSGVGGLWLAE